MQQDLALTLFTQIVIAWVAVSLTVAVLFGVMAARLQERRRYPERRGGPHDRRGGLNDRRGGGQDTRARRVERRRGSPDRRGGPSDRRGMPRRRRGSLTG